MKIVVLAGGTGSSKLLRGLAKKARRFTVIANTGDDVWMNGLYVCPDLDIAMYTLAGIADSERLWGIQGDSFVTLGQLRMLGEDTWFKLGDRDIATHLVRTRMLREGRSLTQVTSFLCGRLGVSQEIIPPSDEHIETRIQTTEGEVHLQEFWVKRRGRLGVRGVRYAGVDKARATELSERRILDADRIIVCPANPVTSIGPILAVRGLRVALVRSRAKKVALSPMIGMKSFSGPAPKLMKAVGIEPSSRGVAESYSDFLDELFIDRSDGRQRGPIEDLGIQCRTEEIAMRSARDEVRLADLLVGT